jgi:hypothetical protein
MAVQLTLEGSGMTDSAGNASDRTPVLWAIVITVLVLGTGPLLNAAPELVGFLVFLPATVAGVGSVGQTAAVSAWIVLASLVTVLRHPAQHTWRST